MKNKISDILAFAIVPFALATAMVLSYQINTVVYREGTYFITEHKFTGNFTCFRISSNYTALKKYNINSNNIITQETQIIGAPRRYPITVTKVIAENDSSNIVFKHYLAFKK